jgi:hypothetical protein
MCGYQPHDDRELTVQFSIGHLSDPWLTASERDDGTTRSRDSSVGIVLSLSAGRKNHCSIPGRGSRLSSAASITAFGPTSPYPWITKGCFSGGNAAGVTLTTHPI